MFIQHHSILILSIISSITFAVIYDVEYMKQNGPSGLIFFKKNDTFINWIRVPEVHYKQWIDALKIWRTISIILGMLCLIFAVLVLGYIIYGFYTNSSGPFDCFGDSKPEDGLVLPNGNLPTNIQQFTIQQQLKRIKQSQLI